MVTVSTPANSAATTADQEVRQFLAAFFGSVECHDLTGFLSLFAADSRFTVYEDHELHNWESFAAFAEEFFGTVGEIAFDMERCAVDSMAPGVAVATGVFKGSGKTTAGEPLVFRHSFTFVLGKQAEVWRIRHAHESSLVA